MKAFWFILVGMIATVLAVGTAYGAESQFWRITFTNTISGDSPAILSELELLYDAEYDVDAVTTGAGGTFSFAEEVGNVTSSFPEDSTFEVSDSTGNDGTYTVASAAYSAGVTTVTIASDESVADGTSDGTISPTDLVDATRADLGLSICEFNSTSWDCDSISTSRRGTPSRQVSKVIDDSVNSTFETSDRISSDTPWPIQYTFYLGKSAPNRSLPDIEGYTLTVPEDNILDKAPNSWRLEYYDAGAKTWAQADAEEGTGISFGNGTAIEDSGGNVIARKLRFTF